MQSAEVQGVGRMANEAQAERVGEHVGEEVDRSTPMRRE